MSRAGLTKKAVQHAWENNISIEELSKTTGKSLASLRSCSTRLKLRLKNNSKKIPWGHLKHKIVNMNTKDYTAMEVAEMLGTSIFSVYSMCARHDKILKKADYGSQKLVKYSKSKKQK